MKKWKITGVLFFLLLLLSPAAVRAEEKSPLTMEVDYGFHGNMKTGSCLPLQVSLENTGEDFKGILEVLVPIQAESHTAESSVWMSGDTWTNNKDRVYTYQKEISLKQGKSGKETLYLELPGMEGIVHVRVKNGKEILVEETINCDSMENDSRILIGITAENPQGMEALDGMLVNIERGYAPEVFVKTIRLNPEEIYPNPDALNQLDVLIVEKNTQFSGEQEMALAKWKADGGFCLELADENVVELFQKFLNGEDRADFMAHMEEMQTYSFGETDGLHNVPIKERPSMGITLFVLAVYVSLVGPGLFIFLKKKKKQKYFWPGVGMISLIFMGIIWGVGRKTAMHAPFISYAGLYEQQENLWTESVSLGIQAPYNDDYHLYLNNDYRLLPMGVGSTGAVISRAEAAEHVNIRLGEKKNKVTIENMSAFTQNMFRMEKNQMVGEEGQIRIRLIGDGKGLSGAWENPSPYSIKNAILVMKNRAAVVGDLPSGGKGEISESRLYSCGNEGMKVLMEEQMDFSNYRNPEYELFKLNEQIWSALREKSPKQVYLLGIVENPDLDFQENSAYRIFGSALVKIPVEVTWEKNGYRWCPNLEAYGESTNGDYSAETNLLFGKEVTVDYPVAFLGELKEVTLSKVEYDEQKHYFPFDGHVAFYSWESGTFEEIHDWEATLWGSVLDKYVSDTGVIRVRYLLEDTMDTRERLCMLPCLQATGKVE